MADFAIWACAAAPACDWQLPTSQGVLTGAAAFLEAYGTNQQETVDLTLEMSLLSHAVRALVDRVERWQGSYLDLLGVLQTMASTHTRNAEWPKTPKKLSAELRRLAPALRTVGVAIDFPTAREAGTGRHLVIVRRHEGMN